MGKKEFKPAPDQDRRDTVLKELDATMLVEAAAGTGKTTLMVERMVNLLAERKCDIGALAAVTFTRKAAAELRARFQLKLEERARSTDGGAGKHLRDALSRIHGCYIGTIHSFCALLLRERPVEAGVDVAFEEIGEEEDNRLRRRAWEEYVAKLHAEDHPILAELGEVGLDVGNLAPVFERFADYPDVAEWPSRNVAVLDLGPAAEALRHYAHHMAQLAPTFPADRGNDRLMGKYERISRMARHADLDHPAELMDILEYFGSHGVVQKCWPKGSGQAKEERDRWVEFTDTYAQSLSEAWREKRYEVVLRAVRPAGEVYGRLRESLGVLNYEDLLLKAAGLLRDKPHIRRYFRRRFTHVLVDEFQDTDPVQAEVLMLLTADDPAEVDWRRCCPARGSLFMVGDPKQSIYRFRRADIVTYTQVREIIEKRGGKVVRLSANFRTVGALVAWVNGVFEGEFPEEATDVSPAYVALEPTRVEGDDGDLTGVSVLNVPPDYGNKDDIAEFEAGLIARWIRNAIDADLTVPRTEDEFESGVRRAATPGDFLILTLTKARLETFARKLQEMNIPHQVAGGAALNRLPELSLLYSCLSAVARPHDPVALVAALRSELFGVSDTTLYSFRRSGGRFSFQCDVPGAFQGEGADAMREAVQKLRRYSLWLSRMPAVAAIERVATDLGLMVRAAAPVGGDVRAGSLGKALELVRDAQKEMHTTAELVDYLGELVELNERYDGVSTRSEDTSKVRIMNLHKAKGLEAPVVFLADPSGEFSHGVELHVDRSGSKVRGYMAVYGEQEGYQRPLLAHPSGWDALSETEEEFRDAEKLRLLYVAATRAGAQLVVAQRVKGNHRNPWSFFKEHMVGSSSFEDPGDVTISQAQGVPIGMIDAVQAGEAVRVRWEEAIRPSYATAAAKEISMLEARPSRSTEGLGSGWGNVIHLLVEAATKSPAAELGPLAESSLAEEELPRGLADDAVSVVRAVMESEIWKRAMASQKRLVEVPFQTLVSERGLTEMTPSILRGVIDLAFLEPEGWVLVDYKTDRIAEGGIQPLADHYSPQLQTYAEAWERCTGQPVKEKGLYFTDAGAYGRVD